MIRSRSPNCADGAAWQSCGGRYTTQTLRAPVSRNDKKNSRSTRAPARIVYVTGKGGVGKSTLARAIAAGGKKTLLVTLGETAYGDVPTEAFDSTDPPTLALDAKRALAHLLERILFLRGLSERVLSSRTFNAVAAAAPGLADVVILGFLDDLSSGKTAAGAYDLIVVDGFSTGHAQAMLEAPLHAAEMLGSGPGRDLIERCRQLTTDGDRFRAVVLASPEELPVTEAAELWASLDRTGIKRLPPAINAVYPTLLNQSQSQYARSGRAGSQAKWYEATCAAQGRWIEHLAIATGAPPARFEHDFADGRITADAAAGLLEQWR
jgi:anion-transporting  ArsA/GET3 family ATPase